MDPGLTSLEGFIIANAVAILLPLAFYLGVTIEKTKGVFNSVKRFVTAKITIENSLKSITFNIL
jgi:hypothetical protein